MTDRSLPAYADTVVVGGGTAGAALAARLAERSDQSILLLEAGPDYGSLAGGGWPAVLLNPCEMAVSSHSWNYASAARFGKPGLLLERARVIGGCSSHNGCAAVWGHRLDYDGWEAQGNPGWGTEALLPLFRAASAQLRVRIPAAEELTPWHQACLQAAPAAGFPVRPDLNDFDLTHGITVNPVNIADRQRWNAAFAYLDAVRDRRAFSIRGDVLADRVVLEGGRAVALDVIGPAGPGRVRAGRVVLCGGAYGSPLVLMRSGIGDPADLREHGIDSVQPLPGVGKNLQDHALIPLLYSGTPQLAAAMARFEADGGLMREEGTTVVARSGQAAAAFDLHIYPISSRVADSWARDLHRRDAEQAWLFGVASALLTPRSRGEIRLAGRDPEQLPRIDHAYFSDPDDRDVRALVDGIEISRSLVAREPVRSWIGTETEPGLAVSDRTELAQFVRGRSAHAYHPVGTCKMGPASEPSSVVDHRGKVHGLEGLYVADASIMPTIPRANTNIPSAVIGEQIALALLA